MAKMDKQEGYNPDSERGYAKVEVDVNAYDGRTFKAWVYSSRKPKPEEPCSARYLNVLVSGAREAGLDPGYIERLAARPTYKPSAHTLALRAQLPELGSLPPMTVEELAATKESVDEDDPESPVHTSIHGYVLRLPKSNVFFKSHRGRDLTARFTRHFRGIVSERTERAAAAAALLRRKRAKMGVVGGRPPEPPAAGEVAHVLSRTSARARPHSCSCSAAHALVLGRTCARARPHMCSCSVAHALVRPFICPCSAYICPCSAAHLLVLGRTRPHAQPHMPPPANPS
jgi:hypothetical protein